MPTLHAMAPKQTERPFELTQLVVLGLFILLTVILTIKFHPERRIAGAV